VGDVRRAHLIACCGTALVGNNSRVERVDLGNHSASLALPPPDAQRIHQLAPLATCALIALVGVAEWMCTVPVEPPALAAPSLDASAELPIHITTHDDPSPPLVTVETELEALHPIPKRKGVPLDDLYPTLRYWIHPIASAPELTTTMAQRGFGAVRVEIKDHPECGGGHCGVDLHATRGLPILAVAPGVLLRVEHAYDGTDGMSGRYVRIQHDDGTVTAYMHMDTIAPGLEAGDRVAAGQQVGTLGSTAVAVPHLHFALEIPNVRGQDEGTHYIDPAPFLVRSVVRPKPERRHPEKPKS
jgi:peptidase M23-like protein